VEAGVRLVTLSRRTVAAIIVLILGLTIALFLDVGPDGGKAPFGNKAERASGGLSGWSDLGLGALVGALVGAVGTHVLRERAEAKREARELRGRLRLILAELTINDRTMELLLSNQKAGELSEGKFEDAAWQHANARLAQLLVDEHHFHTLNIYYRNNANFEPFVFEVAKLELDIADPNNFPAGTAKMILEQQLQMSREAREFLAEYIPGITAEDHYFFPTKEEVEETIEKLHTDKGEGWKKVSDP
jgi:hypothetical protein